jgi:diguanylate cyclase (GGDEF)-like protein
MNEQHRKTLRLITSLALIATAAAALLRVPQSLWHRHEMHDAIRDLEVLPLGPVHLEGAVTYVDVSNKRFWLQDATGAISISGAMSAKVAPGDEVVIQAAKGHLFDPVVGLTSVQLEVSQVTLLKTRVALPQPAPATVKTLPDKDKNGIRVTVAGVLHRVSDRSDGLKTLYFGESGEEVQAIVPGQMGELAAWINSRLQITGVIDAVLDAGGSVRSRYIWVNDVEDVRTLGHPDAGTRLESVRDLYRLRASDDGYRILLRGIVSAQDGPTGLLVEDGFGTVTCDSDTPVSAKPGTPVEVAGYAVRNGVRIDLLHAQFNFQTSTRSKKPTSVDTVPLRTVAAVRSLTESMADSAQPVKLTGIVTFNDSDWQQLFLQDSTGGIFVKYAGHPQVARGQELTIAGLTNSGDYAPIVIAPKFLAHVPGNLPPPVTMTAKAWSGILDGVLVTAKGVIHSVNVRQNPNHLTFDIYTSFGAVHVVAAPEFGGMDCLRRLEDSEVSITGVGGVIFNARRQLIGLQIDVSRAGDIRIIESGTKDPFQSPATPVESLLRFSPTARFGHRTRISGTATMIGDGFLYVQDQTGGARVEARASGLRVGDVVDVVGYPSPEGYSPILKDATVRLQRHDQPLSPQQITAEGIGDGRFDSELVSTEGTLVSVQKSPDSVTLVLQANGRTLDAILYLLTSNQHFEIPSKGSRLRVTGICWVPVQDSSTYLLLTKARVPARLIIRSPVDVHVLQTPAWWNAQRAVLIAVTLFIAVCASLTWIAVLRRHLRRQGQALQEAQDKNDAINKFVGVIQEVSRNKRFTARVPVERHDEIGLLSTEFNNMLSELHARDLAKSEAESKLQHQALTDDLTGLPNRRLLSDRLSQALEMAKRDRSLVALLYVDLDGFKLVNDSLGHTVGDMLLAEVARRLQSRIRKSDTLGRLGGDEFTVVLTHLKGSDDAALVGKSLLEVLSRSFLIEDHEINISASIGIALFPDNGTDANELLQQADSAMYSAKRDGKNRIMYFTPEIGFSVRERLNLENQLRGAIVRGEITVHYQPEFDVATRRLVRFEALARWQHPTLGSIPPDRFIPIAEESGLIIPLGAFVLEHACREARTWQSLSDYPIQVAVNVSTVQFRRAGFVDEVAAILRASGLDPKLLQLELTESIMLDGTDRAASTMKQLAAMGVSIAVDDFGTGYSCFSYLPRLPFNVLKIDRTFVSELDKRVEMAAMIRSLVSLAHNLNMQVVVEGIETVEQLETIEAMGANEVQGYLLGRPTADPKVLLKGSPAASAAYDKAVSSDSFQAGEPSEGSGCGSRMRAQKAGR